MTEQEQVDLNILHQKIAWIHKTAFFSRQHYLRMSPIELLHIGHKTKEDAILRAFEYAQAEVDKLTNAHLKKYPD